ncbi:MAG: hypothetical protein M1546_03275 [Chloroflexi bacterium]|nr:hypothetical protein [Chloroflexota bacterium]
MTQLARICLLGLLLSMLLACTTAAQKPQTTELPQNAPDPDAVKLAALGEQALRLAQEHAKDALLRQIFADSDLAKTTFHFTDQAATNVIQVIVPAPDTPSDQWLVEPNVLSPLAGHAEPGINLQRLKIGPKRVAQAITAHWPGCVVRGMTLYREDDRLTWTAFCNTPAGVVSGNMDNQTGVFRPSDAPPASIPITATPPP